MYKLLIIIGLGILCCNGLFSSCSYKDNDIVPDGLDEKYYVPQGEHEFDSKIVEFHDSTGTFILYRYDLVDAIWNVTGLYPNNAYPLEITLPKEEYLEKALDLIFSQWLDLYPTTTLAVTLPRKILLADTILKKSNSTDEGSLADYTYTVDNICIGNINESVNQITTSSKKKDYKSMLNYAYISYCVDYQKIEVPPAFYAEVDYSKVTSSNAEDWGIVNWKAGMGAKEDMLGFINLIFTEDQDMLDWFWFAGPEDWGMDTKGLIKKKCGILVDEMKRLYGIDLEELTGLKLK